MNTDGVHKTGADSFRGLRWALACLAACLVAGCSHANLSDHAADCVDLDGDGYGAGCARGSDCDDTNPGVTTGCARCLHDGIPGCECSQPGVSAPCGASVGSTDGQLLCGQGQSTCTHGRWGECVITNSVTMGPTSPGMAVKGYGTPAPCDGNPCDPYCKQTTDTGAGLANDAGVVEVDGGGLSIVPGGTSGGIVQSPACAGGTSGTCAHSLCATGAGLTAGCDGVAQSSEPTVQPVFSEDFSDNSAGWVLGTEWQIAATHSSSGQSSGNGDPATDHTASTTDNGVAGAVVGGNTSPVQHDAYYLTSPTINTSASTGAISLSFWRWLNTDCCGWMYTSVEISTNNGTSWTKLWETGDQVSDSVWTQVTFDITAYKSATTKIRFGVRTVYDYSNWTVSNWNIDDVLVTITAPQTTPTSGCVQTVCSAMPSCCSTAWTAACIAQAQTSCLITCASNAGTCVVCYRDGVDHDGDGASYNAGDCLDCDPAVGPGAFDWPGNLKDEDCNGIVDDGILSCDTGLALASADPKDHARAIGLCQFTTAAEKKWGVIEAKLVQADATSAPASPQYGILPQFGNASNNPREGSRLAAYSSGTARRPIDPSYVNPNGSGYNPGTTVSYPTGFPKNSASCPTAGGGANDSSGLWLKIRVPTNALSFKYRFRFFSAEYPEWVCTYFNDIFIALLYGSQNPYTATKSYNISFDSNNNPVSVNVGFFDIPGGPNVINHADLIGTGMDGSCSGQSCGGATNWLMSSAPVTPGETITMHFSIWDTGDYAWDSTVLIDGWEWSPTTASIETLPDVTTTPPTPTFSDGWFTRDYDAQTTCGVGPKPFWGQFMWTTTAPSDSKIEFFVRTADSIAGLDTAANIPLAVAKSNPPPMTEYGAALVHDALLANGLPTNKRYMRVVAHFVQSSDNTVGPTLWKWEQEISCVP